MRGQAFVYSAEEARSTRDCGPPLVGPVPFLLFGQLLLHLGDVGVEVALVVLHLGPLFFGQDGVVYAALDSSEESEVALVEDLLGQPTHCFVDDYVVGLVQVVMEQAELVVLPLVEQESSPTGVCDLLVAHFWISKIHRLFTASPLNVLFNGRREIVAFEVSQTVSIYHVFSYNV
ncbi:unnamed protein product [Ixodes pacificus]